MDVLSNEYNLEKAKQVLAGSGYPNGFEFTCKILKGYDSGEMAAAFALYPVSMKQLIDIADSGNIMPPKTTWFEPKLRSGLAIHKLA